MRYANSAKALNLKNMVQAWVDCCGYDDYVSALYELRNQGFISTYTMNCFSDIISDLYFSEDYETVTNGKGEIVYRRMVNGYYTKVKQGN